MRGFNKREGFHHRKTYSDGMMGEIYIEDHNQKYYPYFEHMLDFLIEEMKGLVNAGFEITWGKTENWCTINGKVFNVPKEVWDKRSDPNYVPEPLSSPVFGIHQGKLDAQPVTNTDLIEEIIKLDPKMESERNKLYRQSKHSLIELLQEKRSNC